MTIEEYYQEFTQDLIARAGADENFTRSSFVEAMCSTLEDEGFMSGFAQTDYKNTIKGLAVDAWSFNDDLGCLTLIIGDYRDSGNLETLTKTDIEKAFRRLVKFVEVSASNGFAESLDEAMPATELAWLIRKSHNEILRISLVLVSNALLSTKVASLPKEQAGNFTTSYEVWDLGRIYRANTSGKAREDIWIDFSTEDGGSLPCLPAFLSDGAMQSYLLVIPGNILADLYQSYGERLLEQNVRTFLQFRGNINKGIRNTIANEPHMFFSYNNGISATAEEIITSKENSQILKIKNLQIVNGGQTTASIFTARRKEKLDLDNVYVQVKLSIVPPAKVEEIVPRISQYSNTQNKVNAADFFSNHPFHLRIEEFSRRLWAKSAEGQIQETHWFYERAHGQYANKQANLTLSEQKKFRLMNPRSQMFTKTDLCKFILTFDEVPHVVSLGAQKAFAGSPRNPGFVGRIAKEWEEHQGKSFNEIWFKNAIAKAIFFRQVNKLVTNQDWYGRGYKANIVTYTLAKFALMVRESGNCFDFLRIWNMQALPESIEFKLMQIAKIVNEILVYPPIGETSNVTEWAKRSECWELVRAVPIKLGSGFVDFLISHQAALEREVEGGRTQIIQDNIQAQTYVVEKGAVHWKKLREWNLRNKKLSPREIGILETACSIPKSIPSDKQAPILVAAEKRAIENGFFPES